MAAARFAAVAAVFMLRSVAAADAATNATAKGASPQGGILEGVKPNEYSAADPIKLFIIQAGIIIIFCRLLHYPLSLIGQPRVIAEVIGGILLGPSVLARIPGFKDAIFPTASMPVLSNVANLGLILFLFLIALEVDMRLFTANWRIALSVGFAGMVLPFGLGCALAYGLHTQFASDGATKEVSFGVYALFIGTALAITAFPVLCRILSELNLLQSTVGVIVLAAGVGNDVCGWILLALCVALVNNGSGLTALWVLLVCVAWILFLVFAVRPLFLLALRKTGSLQNGPTQGMVALTLLLVLGSAWFTSIIGVHAIFGGFLVGLICPHDDGFTIKLTEKIEDLITVLFLPLYFALSGLNTNLGLLNDGITWAYVIAVIAVAFAGKIIGGTLAARAMGIVWRESLTIGCLMSCKGLVELIVLNIGLQAGILSQRGFTMFVVMALVTTFATTPLTKLLYPPSYQKKLERWKRGEIDWDGHSLVSEAASPSPATVKVADSDLDLRRLLVYLRLDSLPSLFTFISLLGSEQVGVEQVGGKANTSGSDDSRPAVQPRPLVVHALRLVELTERTSSVMQVTETDVLSRRDPVVNAFNTFSQLHDVAVSGSTVVAPEPAYADTVVAQAAEHSSDLALIPWSEVGSNTEDQSMPFAAVSAEARFSNRSHLDFMRDVLAKAVCTTGILIGNGFSGTAPTEKVRSWGPSRANSSTHHTLARSGYWEGPAPLVVDKSHHVFLPFIGGVDDRVAARFLAQLAKNPLVTATLVHLDRDRDRDRDKADKADKPDKPDKPDTAGSQTGAAALEKNTDAEDASAVEPDAAFLSRLTLSLPAEVAARISITRLSVTSDTALAQAVKLATDTLGCNPTTAGHLIILGRRHPQLEEARKDKEDEPGNDMSKTIGLLGEKMAKAGIMASVLVIQAAGQGRGWRI